MNNIRLNLIALVLIQGMLFPFAASAVGNGASGGLYKYYYTSGAYLESVKSYIYRALTDSPASELEALSQKYSDKMHVTGEKKIDWKLFANYVAKTRGDDGTAKRKQINPQGFKDTLYFTYTKSPNQIIALEEFYLLYHKKPDEITLGDAIEIERMLIHEASHLFGLGTDDDDDVSRDFSLDLMSIINRYWFRCSADGGSFNLANCRYSKKWNQGGHPIQVLNLSISSLDGARVSKPGSCQFRMDLWRAEFDYSGPGQVSRRWIALPSNQQPSIAGENHIGVEYDISAMQPGDVVVLSSACFEAYLDGQINKRARLKYSLVDENKKSFVDDSKWEVPIKSQWTYLKVSLLKTDSGMLVLQGNQPPTYVNF